MLLNYSPSDLYHLLTTILGPPPSDYNLFNHCLPYTILPTTILISPLSNYDLSNLRCLTTVPYGQILMSMPYNIRLKNISLNKSP